MAPSLQAKDLAKICYYAAVNKKLPEEDLQAQWEALSQDPEALMRVSNRFGELRSEALISVQPESSLYEAFYQRFINETGTRLTLHQYATIAEDARMRAPRVNWAHENQITKLRKHQDMKEAKPEVMAQANTEEQAALHDNTTPLDGLRGLWNLGSTCYANAVWKMFANCDVFVSALMNLDMSKLAQATLLEHHSVELQHNVKQFTEFAALLVQFYRDLGDLADPKPIHPTRLMDLTRRLKPGFKADQQQDAAEFADFLFATLDICVRIASGPNLPVGQTFYRTVQRLQCECGYKSEEAVADRTMKIAIDPDIMSASEGNVTLTQLISNEFRNTPAPEDYVCEGCQLSKHTTISRFLTTIPSYLFIHLKRFQHDDGEGRKVKSHIDFPIMALDILPVVHTSCRGQCSTTYDCISIVEHIGDTLEAGHYITKNRRHGFNDWISHDDTKIREVPASSIVTKAAYILLYKQRTTPTGLQVLDERPAVFHPKPPMSKVQALKHKYEQARKTADAGRERPTALQARFELNEKRAKEAYEQALAEE